MLQGKTKDNASNKCKISMEIKRHRRKNSFLQGDKHEREYLLCHPERLQTKKLWLLKKYIYGFSDE